MKRYEAVQAIWDKLLKHHEEAFGWANDTRDCHTCYYLLDRPADFDYEAWKEKATQLEKVHGFLLHLEGALRRLDEIDAPTAIYVGFYKPDEDGYNVDFRLRNHRLYYQWGYHYRARAARLVPIETTDPISEDELRAKRVEALFHTDNWRALEIMKETILDELNEAKRHLEWLEEEVGGGE